MLAFQTFSLYYDRKASSAGRISHEGKNAAMRQTSAVSDLTKCMIQSLLILLKDKALEEITVTEIAEKAGVNGSTYSRHFVTKKDVIRRFYQLRLDQYLNSVREDISPKDYLTGFFTDFLHYKQELILLDRRGLSFLLLEELNARIPQVHGNSKAAVHSLACNYHIGGVFNSFRYWLFEDMATPPDKLAHQCLMFLPRDFCPYLLRKSQ